MKIFVLAATIVLASGQTKSTSLRSGVEAPAFPHAATGTKLLFGKYGGGACDAIQKENDELRAELDKVNEPGTTHFAGTAPADIDVAVEGMKMSVLADFAGPPAVTLEEAAGTDTRDCQSVLAHKRTFLMSHMLYRPALYQPGRWPRAYRG